jgi:hypothetical protein
MNSGKKKDPCGSFSFYRAAGSVALARVARHTGVRLTGPQVKQLDKAAIHQFLTHPSARLPACLSHELIATLGVSIAQVAQHVGTYRQHTTEYEVITSVTGMAPIIE